MAVAKIPEDKITKEGTNKQCTTTIDDMQLYHYSCMFFTDKCNICDNSFLNHCNKFVKIVPNELADIAVKAAPFVAPFNPFDPSSLSLMEAFTPPSWSEKGMAKYILGTDGQGRDMLATILYGSRISLIVGFSAVIFALVLGVGLGLEIRIRTRD